MSEIKDLKFYKRTGYPCCHFTENKIYQGYQGYKGDPYYTTIMDNGEMSSAHHGGFEEIEMVEKSQLDQEKQINKVLIEACVAHQKRYPNGISDEFVAITKALESIGTEGKTMKQNLDWHGVDSVCHPKELRGKDE